YVRNIGFRYNDTVWNPKRMYKFGVERNFSGNQSGNQTTASEDWSYERLRPVQIQATDSIFFHPEEVSDFSIFGAYGVELQRGEDEPGPGQNATDPGPSDPGGGGGAGTGTQPEPNPQPEPEAIELDIELERNNTVVQQGETVPVNFSVTNEGEVDVENPFVDADVKAGWSSGRKDFESIEQGETVDGQILMSVYEDEIPDSYNINFRAQSAQGNIQDIDILQVDVELRQDIDSLRIIEAPSFLNLPRGLDKDVALLVENNGDFEYDDITLDFRNVENCVAGVSGSHQLDIGETDTLEYTVEAKDTSSECQGVMVLESAGGQALGIQPVQINVEDPTLLERLQVGILPIIVLIWTLITVFEGVKRYGGQTVSRQREERR
ncbi:MAG: hypothetical protein V5A72_01530, partial [Candidatus Nanohaloarchaea archaeon]